MIHKSTIDFLVGLKKNNSKGWFEANRTAYGLAKDNFSALVESILIELSKLDNRYEGVNVKDCIFRINRDVRFSANKAPYKTHFAGVFALGGKKTTMPGLYFHLDPEGCFTAAGLWMPDAEQLSKIRQEIDYNLKEFQAILKHKSFMKRFGTLDNENSLKRAPKGYSEDHEGIEFLKLKSFVVSEKLDLKMVYEKNLAKQIVASFKDSLALRAFLERAIS